MVAALLLTSVADARPAVAAATYDSTWIGESAFVTLIPGETTTLTVFFQNSGTATWSVGTPTEVDLAACLDDKLTCNVVPEESAWNPGGASAWLSSTRYATSVQSSVAPGAIGTFTYTVKTPSTATAGTYRFNGDLVLAASATKVHPEGYYHDVTVSVPPPVVTKPTVVSAASLGVSEVLVTFSANMSCASLAAGTYVIKDSSGAVVDTTAPATGASQITLATSSTSGTGASDCKTVTLYLRGSTSATLGRGATYTLQVTGVTDAGGTGIDTASNTVSFVGADNTGPAATALVFLSPSLVRVVFSEPMTATSSGTGIANTANYRLDGTNGTTVFTSCVSVAGGLAADCTLATPYATANRGDHTLIVTEVTDTAGNLISPNPTTLTATYPPTSVRPTVKSAVSPAATQLSVTFDRTMNTAAAGNGCANPANYSITKADGTASGLGFSVSCAVNQATLTLSGAASGTAYVLVITGVAELYGAIVDPNPTSASFTVATDTTRPTVLVASVPVQALVCDVASPAPCGRSQFTVTFNEPMTQGNGAGGVSNTAGYVLKDASGASVSVASCSSVDTRNVATTGAVTCVLTRPVAAGSYGLTIGSSSAPTDVAGNALAAATVTISFR